MRAMWLLIGGLPASTFLTAASSSARGVRLIILPFGLRVVASDERFPPGQTQYLGTTIPASRIRRLKAKESRCLFVAAIVPFMAGVLMAGGASGWSIFSA